MKSHSGNWPAGELIGTLAVPPVLPYALDADVAGLVVLAARGEELAMAARSGIKLRSIDPARTAVRS